MHISFGVVLLVSGPKAASGDGSASCWVCSGLAQGIRRDLKSWTESQDGYGGCCPKSEGQK